MASKTLLLLGLLFALVCFVSSAAATRQLAAEDAEKNVVDEKYGGGYPGHGGYPPHHGGYPPYHGGCRYGCCRKGYHGCICCGSADEVPEQQYQPEVKN